MQNPPVLTDLNWRTYVTYASNLGRTALHCLIPKVTFYIRHLHHVAIVPGKWNPLTDLGLTACQARLDDDIISKT